MRKQKGFAQIYLVMGVVVLMMAGGFYLYYKDSQATIRAQAQVMAAQQVQIAEHEEIVKQFQEDKALQLEITKQIGIAFDESRQEIDDLRNKFDKINEATQKQRDIGKLASSRKAKRIEKKDNQQCY
jgi:hypothetical protein